MSKVIKRKEIRRHLSAAEIDGIAITLTGLSDLPLSRQRWQSSFENLSKC